MFAKVKTGIAEIVAIAETVPEPYRARCFEILLNALLAEQPSSRSAKSESATIPAERSIETSASSVAPTNVHTLPAKVRTFLKRTGVTEEGLRSSVLIENSEVHFIHQPAATPISQAQVQWSLLLALKSALEGGEFSVDPEAARSMCIEKGVYDRTNFITNFKNNKKFFQKLPEAQGEPVKISGDGEQKLAEILKSFQSANS